MENKVEIGLCKHIRWIKLSFLRGPLPSLWQVAVVVVVHSALLILPFQMSALFSLFSSFYYIFTYMSASDWRYGRDQSWKWIGKKKTYYRTFTTLLSLPFFSPPHLICNLVSQPWVKNAEPTYFSPFLFAFLIRKFRLSNVRYTRSSLIFMIILWRKQTTFASLLKNWPRVLVDWENNRQ